MTRPPTRARFPLRAKLGLWAALLSILPAMAVGYILIDQTVAEVERSILGLQIAVTDDLARTIDAAAADAEGDVVAIAAAFGDASLEGPLRLRVASRILETSALDQVVVYDVGGETIDRLALDRAPALALESALAEDLRRRATREGVVVLDAFEAPGGPRYGLVAPIRADDRVTGFLLAPISLVPVQARVERLHLAHLAVLSGQLFVVDSSRRVLAHSNAELAHDLTAAPSGGVLDGIELDAVDPARPLARQYGEGAGVGTIVGLDRRPWTVVVQVPSETAFASVERMRRTVFATVALTIVLALVLALAFARQVTAPLSRLSQFARDLAARRFDRRVEIRTGDELGLLGDALSNAAADLEASEARIRRETAIRSDLGRYLPGELVEKIVSREQDMELGGTRQAVTVLFADVVAFTPLTERLPPEEVVALLNELFTVLTDVVFRHGGTVDKFVGDCVMAVWGAPRRDEEHARHALEAAEDMLRWLETANPGWEERYGATVRLAIGVNSGEVVVGNVGSARRMEYTAIGDVVNVAARLEAIARPQQILVTEATRRAAGDAFEYVEVGERLLAGRTAPLTLWEVVL